MDSPRGAPELALAETLAVASDDAAPLDLGARVGRYVVLGKLGAGGMGVVHAAHDPELDRKIALKLVRPGVDGDEYGARLRREARALARLAHPNVVAVHDVGALDARVWLAMELVDGTTLRAWLGAPGPPGPRPWRSVVEVMLQAGRGLAAAHAAGLLHRDFKPENVMIGREGRVRVMDFGLVHRPSAAATDPSRPTHTTGIAGTPAYMAPEQLLGAELTAAADQFAFCVTLWEGLHGERPFAGETLEVLTANVVAGNIRAPPAGVSVPGWLRRACIRGLDPDPRRRWPTLAALLEILAHDPRRTWMRAGALAGALVLASGASYALAVHRSAGAVVCSSAADELADAWSAGRRDTVRAAFTAASALAAASADRVIERLDAYADAWLALRTEACETHRQAEQSDALYDLRVRCLRDRRLGLQAAVDLLERPDDTVVEKAVDLVAGLEPLGTCADPDALAAAVPPPDDPNTAAAVAALEDRLPAVQAQTLAGRYDVALAASDDLLRQAEALGYAPLIARLTLARGHVEMERSQPVLAVRDLERASWLAIEHGLADVAAEALARQIFIEGTLLSRFDRALALAGVADAFARRAPDPLRARALLHNNLGTVHGSRHEHDRALAEYRQAAELWARVPGAEIDLAATLNNIGVTLVEVGRAGDMRAPLERALDLYTRTHGPDHPQTLGMRVNLAMLLHQASDPRGALTLLEEVLPRLHATVGGDHRFTANALYYSGLAHRDLGDPQVALRDLAAAVQAYRSSGEVSVLVGIALVELGRTRNMLAQPSEAIDVCNAANAMYLELPDESPFRTARVLCLAEAAFLQNSLERAQELVLQVWPRLDGLSPDLRGLARYLLARTSAQLGNRPAAEIRRLATAATEDMRALGTAYYPPREALSAWMATLP